MPRPARLISTLKANKSANVTVKDRYSILQAGMTPGGSFLFSVQAGRGRPLEPCPTGICPRMSRQPSSAHTNTSAPKGASLEPVQALTELGEEDPCALLPRDIPRV